MVLPKSELHFYQFSKNINMIFMARQDKNKANSTGPTSAARFKPDVHPRSKLTKCPEQEQQLK